MGTHLRTRFTENEVMEILERYLTKEIGIKEALGLLKLKRRQFFKVLKRYQTQEQTFCLAQKRSDPPRKITEQAHQMILQELAEEKRLIEDKNNPVRFYNYSYVQSLLAEKHQLCVSLPTIITRAKKTITTWVVQLKKPMIERCLRITWVRWYNMMPRFICGHRLQSRNGI